MKKLNLIGSFSEGLELDRRGFFAFLLLYFSYANWYTVATKVLPLSLPFSLKEASLTWSSFGFDFLIALSMLVGGLLIEGRSKLAFLRFSAVFLIFLTFMLPLVSTVDLAILLVSMLGIPAGFASLALVILFVEKTFARERGRIAGAMVSLAIFTSPVIIIASRSFGSIWTFGTLIVLNFIVVILSFVVRDLPQEQTSGRRVLGKFGKNYVLYFAAWILISFNNGFFSPLYTAYVESFPGTARFGFVLQYFTTCVIALLGGFLMDWYGRKPLLLLGVVFLGISASLLALVSNPITLVINWIVSGGSWGLFLPTFYLFIWGEAAVGEVKPFTYSLGLMVFHLERSFGFLVFPYFSRFEIVELALISSGILFLGAVPLIAAQETLPLEERETLHLSRYLRKLKEEVERR